jgi:hypothetical protein
MAAIFVVGLCAVPLPGQTIQQISTCAPDKNGVPQNGPQYTCTAGSGTQKLVVAPDGQTSINQYAGAGITDEHSSVLPPGSVRLANGSWNTDYLFFVASNARGVVQAQPGADIGVLVLSGAGPQTGSNVGPMLTPGTAWDSNFQWTMDFASADGYGRYCNSSGTNCIPGTVLLPPILQGNCPQPATPPFSSVNSPLPTDTTFDLSYAAAGSIVHDPTGAPGSMLMLYEGANGCTPTAVATGNASVTMGLATSDDYGRNWPTYRGAPYCTGAAGPFCDAFEFYNLPYNNPYQGPRQGTGAFGAGLCKGDDCAVTPPDSYGRYQILPAGAGEPSAFVDYGNSHSSTPPYVYLAVRLIAGGIGVARAQLGTPGQTPQFEAFNGWDPATGQPIWVAVGNSANLQMASILPDVVNVPPGTASAACQGNGQAASQPQISYYPPTGEYVLLFVCTSASGDPAGTSSADLGSDYGKVGSAWFWTTSTDLESQKWNPPQQIYGTWANWYLGVNKDGSADNCHIYNGWYPTFMSLGQAPGVLSQNGYVFSMDGDLNGCTAYQYSRQYVSHAFTITAK